MVLACATAAQTIINIGLRGTSAGSHPMYAWNTNASAIVMIYHGLGNPVPEYFALAARYANAGYVALVPKDNSMDIGLIPGDAPWWGKSCAIAVRDFYAYGRPIAIIGHSMGGGAAMAAARYVPGLSAYVAMHPAPILSGNPLHKVSGPILFTTGTLDDGSFGGGLIGATAPMWSKRSYNSIRTMSPKALVNVIGNHHMDPVNIYTYGGLEGNATFAWIECFTRRIQKECNWLKTTLCKSPGLEWCSISGLSEVLVQLDAPIEGLEHYQKSENITNLKKESVVLHSNDTVQNTTNLMDASVKELAPHSNKTGAHEALPLVVV